MSEPTVKRAATGQAGSSFFLFLLVMAALLGVVTAYAIKYNPLYSDRDAYGISKYALIERCKEALENPANVDVPGPQGTQKLSVLAQQPGFLQAGEHLVLQSATTSPELVASVNAVDRTKLGMLLPVHVVAENSSGAKRSIAPAALQCTFARSEGFKAALGGGGQ